MDATDPLCAISSPARLLPRTLGPGPISATAASPSKAREALLEAISVARHLKGSEELVKQAKMVLKEHGDIRVLYHDDGVKARPPANGIKEQQGRRPSLDRRRAHFTMKHTSSKPVPVVDQSKLSNILDPVEFFMTLDRLEEAEEEIKQLNGETKKRVLNFDPVDEPKRRPGLRGRKSVRSFKVIEDAETQDPIEVPARQTETMTESQLSQDDMHAVADKNEQYVHSRSGEQAISDVSGKEDSLAEKDGRDDLTYLLTSLQDLDESEEEDFIRKTLGIKKIRKDKVSLRNSIPGVRPLRSNTLQKSSMRVRPPESPLPQSRQDRISELEKHLFPGDAANDKCEDDKSEDSPDIVMGEPSLVHDASDVLMTDEIFTASEIDRETPNLVVREAEHVLDLEPNMPEHVLDLEPNMPDHADERQPGGSSLGLYSNTEVGKEKVACSRNNISVKEGDVPVGYPTIDRSHNETEVSSHHVDGRLAEVLVSTPGRHVDPDGIDRTSHASEDSIQHLEVVKGGGVLQDKSSQPVEMPLEDSDLLNQPQMPGESIKKLTHDLPNALSLTKQKKQQAAQKGERKQQSKRGKKVADKSSQPVEMPQEDIDPLNQPQMQGESIKKLADDLHNALSPTKQKKQQAAQKGKRKQQSKRGRKVADESNHALEIPQANFGSEQENFGSENPSQDDVNIEGQTVVMSNTLSPNEEKGQKGAQRRNKTKELNKRKSLGDAGLAWQSGVRRSTRVRSRPLEHWLGERFLYGRIHDTMVTVVGIKAYSPSQDGKKALKVKSFVPEQYSDVVAESAKY